MTNFTLKHELDSDGKEKVISLYKNPVCKENFLCSWKREYEGSVVPELGVYPERTSENMNPELSHSNNILQDVLHEAYEVGRRDELADIQKRLGIRPR